MASAEPSADCTYEELCRIVDDNCEPFETVEQAKRFIKAASMLRRREPSEIEESGTRISKRDLESQIVEARKALAILTLNNGPATVIVPSNFCR